MLEQFHKQLSELEEYLDRNAFSFTVPIYSVITGLPQDVIEGQLALDDFSRLLFFYEGTWYAVGGSGVPVLNGPEDTIEGEISLTADNNLCWYVDGAWQANAFWVFPAGPITNLMEDSITSQIVLGLSGTICWYGTDGLWRGAVGSIA